MNRIHYVQALRKNEMTASEYPKPSILLAMLLIYLAPFTSSLLSYAAFVICVYRVLRYDARVFATDYCLLIPIASLFSTSGGLTLLIILCLLAGVWYTVLHGIRANQVYVVLIILLNYLILRMQMEISRFVLCFGQIFVVCVLLHHQNKDSAVHISKAYCINLIVSSVYAFALRNTWQIAAVRGPESEAIWGTGIMRFMGLQGDPNYYMTMLIVGLALLIKLKEFGYLSTSWFVIQGVLLTAFGILTYSKTFVLVFVLLGGFYVVWQFWSRKILSGVLLTVAAVLAFLLLAFADFSPFAVTVQRLLEGKDLSSLTTGRTDIYAAYWKKIIETLPSFLFGYGLKAEGLFKDPHNIYIEIVYYLGVTGFALIGYIFGALMHMMRSLDFRVRNQHVIAKYTLPILVMVLFFSLHGIFQVVAYGDFFLAFLSLLIVPKEKEKQLSNG